MDLSEEGREQEMTRVSTKNPTPNSAIIPLMNGHVSPKSASFEVRLFYVRIAPCVIKAVPDYLTLCHLPRDIGCSLDINGRRISSSEASSLSLRRDRIDKDSSEVTYVSTDNVRITGAVNFEVLNGVDLLLCGNLERLDSSWGSGIIGFENQVTGNDEKSKWTMNCYPAASIVNGSSAFFHPKLGISSPSVEVYVAGCCSSFPLILTETVNLGSKKKPVRTGALDAIPENEETERDTNHIDRVLRHRSLQPSTDEELDGYHPDYKLSHTLYPDDYIDDEHDDSQLSWFNAGVRVGVGIGLGMCLGIGIGVGLLMHSYQATTRHLKRRFL